MNVTGINDIKTNDRSFQSSDLWVAAALLGVIFFLAPAFPQLSNSHFAFFYRSVIFLLFVAIWYRIGWTQTAIQLSQLPLILPGLVILLLTCAGLFHTPDLYRAKAKLSMLIAAFLLYGVSSLLPFSRRQRLNLAWCLILGGTVAAWSALYTQWVGHGALIDALSKGELYDARTQQEMIASLQANRAIGRFGNPNHLAGYLVLTLWPLWLLWKRGESRIVLAVAALLITAGIYRTFSRSGLLVLFGSIVLFAFYECYSRGIRVPIKKILWIPLGIITVGIVAALMIPSSLFGGRLLTVSTIVARIHFFRGGVAIIKDHPWLGVGPEGYEGFFCSYIRPGDLESRYVHNVFLEASVEGGIVGLILLLWLLGTAFRYLKHRWDADTENRPELFAALGSGLSLLLLSSIDFHNNLMETWTVPVFLLGICHVRRERIHYDGRTFQYLAPVVAVCLVVAWGLLVLARFYNETTRQNAYYLQLDERLPEARRETERAVFWDGSDAESWNRLGYYWSIAPGVTAKRSWLQYARRAVELAPRRATFRADYADALYATGFPEEAEYELKTAQRLFPARPRYYQKLAELYRALGQTNQAEIQENIAQQLTEEIENKRP